MEDIIQSFPEYDDDHETWYLTHLWAYYRGKRVTYTTCDCDGNHEPCSSKEAGEILNNASADWLRYSRWVVENQGKDPCGEFMVNRRTKIRRNIVATFEPWAGSSKHGMMLARTVVGRRMVWDWHGVPSQLLDFMELVKVDDRQCAPWAKSVGEGLAYLNESDCCGYANRLQKGFYAKLTAEWTQPRDERTVRREIVKSAKSHIEREEERSRKKDAIRNRNI